jgi:hypothetical protein
MQTENRLSFSSGSEAIMYIGKLVLAKRTDIEFNLDDDIRRSIYKKAYLSFTGGRACKEESIDPSKGIWLIGGKGVGKSILMKVMHKMYKDTARRFKWVNCRDLKDFLLNGCSKSEIMEMYGKALKCDLYIDDTDIDFVDWNQGPSSIVAQILYERNELFNYEGFKTHLSSYLPRTSDHDRHLQLIKQGRNFGVLDRVREMTNLIIWEGESLRK